METENQKKMKWTEQGKAFCRKFFMEGQKLDEKHVEALASLPPDAPLLDKVLVRHRRAVGILIPLVLVETLWWCQAFQHNYFTYFPDRYKLSITMIFGAMVAGMTSEGGGAVAFPVMTLALGIAPTVARDFSVMIQSVGMSAASFTILWMKVKLEKHSLMFCSLGAIVGMILGFEVVDPALSAEEKKLAFVSIWFSFAFALYLLNRENKRLTFDAIPNFGAWQAVVLVFVGLVGGVFSAVAGSGVDICSFSVLSLLFRVSEKVSTPTSIVLMAINASSCFYWRQLMTTNGISTEAWHFFTVCVPVVVIGAPIGSVIATHFHRKVLASMIYILDTVALVTALTVLHMTPKLWIISGCLLAGLRHLHHTNLNRSMLMHIIGWSSAFVPS